MNTPVTNWIAGALVLSAVLALTIASSCRPDVVAGHYSGYTCEITDVGVEAIPKNSTALRMLSTETGVRHRRGNLTLPRLPVLELLEYDVTRGLDVSERPFVQLPNLETLQLFHRATRTDDFRFVLNAGIFDGLQGLRRLILSDLGLEDLPVDVFDGLDSLRILELNHNKLSQVPAGTFTACCQPLSILILSRNQISDLGLISMRGLSGLLTLDLSSNTLMTVNTLDFAGLENITNLDLTGNKLERIHEHALHGLSRLQSLHLSENRLTFSAEDSAPNTISPSEGGGNSPGVFSGLSTLKTLEISNNKITFLPSQIFEDLVSIRRLDISGNSIHTLSSEHFACLQSLAELDLSRNSMTTLDRTFARVFNRLEWLDLSSNPWHCNCDLYWLAEWLRCTTDSDSFDATIVEVNSLHNTKCSIPVTGELLTEAFVNNSVECDRGFDEDTEHMGHAEDVLTTEDKDYGVTSESRSCKETTTETVPSIKDDENTEITSEMFTDPQYIRITDTIRFPSEQGTKSEHDYLSTEVPPQQLRLGSEKSIKELELGKDISSTTTVLLSAQATQPQTTLNSITENIRTLDSLLVTEIANLEQMEKCDMLLSSVNQNMKTLDSLLQETTANINTLNRLLLMTIETMKNADKQLQTRSSEANGQRNNSYSATIRPNAVLQLAMLLTFVGSVQWIRYK